MDSRRSRSLRKYKARQDVLHLLTGYKVTAEEYILLVKMINAPGEDNLVLAEEIIKTKVST